MIRLAGAGLVAAAALLLTAACGTTTDSQSDETAETASADLRVASFDFAESTLLAEMYALAIESIGVPVVRLGPVGSREIVAPAMELDRIDLVPEYLGAALQYAGGLESNPDAAAARTELNERLAERGLTVLEASPAEDKNAIVVTTETAEQHMLTSISDLSPVVGGMRFGGPVECANRPLCLAGLEAIYGLHFAEFVPLQSLSLTAEALRQGEIDVGLMFSTASELETEDFVELIDDRQMQPAENVVPVVRIEALERWGADLVAVLDAVSQRLTTKDLRTLNLRVANGESIEEVAGAWLAVNGLLGSD